jgi:hypothetical protein
MYRVVVQYIGFAVKLQAGGMPKPDFVNPFLKIVRRNLIWRNTQ